AGQLHLGGPRRDARDLPSHPESGGLTNTNVRTKLRLMSTAAAIARPTKGEETRAQILAAAVEQASRSGFESLTIGGLAEKTGMSKSGLFAHFGSKLELQLAALDESARQYTEQVFMPAMKAPPGLRRLQALLENWVRWP